MTEWRHDRPIARRSIARALGLALAAVLSTLAAVFFGYYTTRLLYINVAGLVPVAQRQSGMYIGAVAFPVATLVFGNVALRSGRPASRAMRGQG